MREYEPNNRVNDPVYLIRQAEELLKIAQKNKNSSALIYACLESRIALEWMDLYLILASVDENEYRKILDESKPKNGIDKLNNKYKTLKEKYQLFFLALNELLDIKSSYYDFKKSKELQNKLSTYIHSYYMLEDEINFDSEIMQNVFPLVKEVHDFIKTSLNYDGKSYTIIGLQINSMPENDRLILKEWKDDPQMTFDQLKEKLKLSIEKNNSNLNVNTKKPF